MSNDKRQSVEYPVFYSWQNDLPKRCNRAFIGEAREEAVPTVVAEGQVEDSPRGDSSPNTTRDLPAIRSPPRVDCLDHTDHLLWNVREGDDGPVGRGSSGAGESQRAQGHSSAAEHS